MRRGFQKVTMRSLQGDSYLPLEALLLDSVRD
jgi:hypothetical protein